MKLPSYLARSRHGVFYFRITFLIDFIRKEKRWSLHTKNPVEAKRLSLIICATLGDNSMVKSIMSRVGQTPAYAGLIANEYPRGIINMAGDKKVAAELITTFQSRNGSTMKLEINQSDPADVAAAKALAETFIREDTKNRNPAIWDRHSALNDIRNDIVQDVIAVNIGNGGASVEELINKYQVRQKDKLGKKTLYEYENMQRKFAAWLKSVRNNGDVTLYRVSRPEISSFIDVLQKDGRSLQTIQKKYLASLNGLFEFAQSAGDYPKGDLPTKEHKIYTRRDQKRSKAKSGWKPFSNDDLSLIFNAGNLLARDKPCDYWLPLLGLYTGGRLSELCQLKPANIRQIDGIWAVDINDEDDDQSVKTEAGIRIIPLHPQLIELGFLEYVEDVRPFGGTIFPYQKPDRFNHYGKTPGRRFGEYLDSLGISDRQKVFHSFRSTSNDRLKQNGVPEESRCQFIGHEHDTVNSKTYSEEYGVKFMHDNVAIHLTFDHVDFSHLQLPRQKDEREIGSPDERS
jgi:integrase